MFWSAEIPRKFTDERRSGNLQICPACFNLFNALCIYSQVKNETSRCEEQSLKNKTARLMKSDKTFQCETHSFFQRLFSSLLFRNK